MIWAKFFGGRYYFCDKNDIFLQSQLNNLDCPLEYVMYLTLNLVLEEVTNAMQLFSMWKKSEWLLNTYSLLL